MAYTYTGTPNQRIEQAKRRISTESVDVNSTLSAYQNRVAEIQQQEQAQAQQQEYKSNASGIVRFGDTLGEFFKDVATGLEKAFEGIIDFGAGTIGTIAGWAGNNNFKQEMTNFVARDLIEEQWDAARNAGLDVDFDDSYINDLSETGQGIVKGVAQGVGQMLPMVVATIATGGAAGAAAAAGKISAGTANAIVKAGQVANMVGLGASAAGRGTEEALNTEIVDEYGNVTKPTLDRAYLYGLATGAVEMATEKLVGGIYSKAVGGGIADNLISKLAKSAKFSKAVKFGLDVMGEGVEEMVSASVEKTLQTIYNSTDGKMHWENPDIQDVFVSGVVGTLTSAVMGGGQVAVRKASSVATTQDAMLDIENTLKKANNLSKKGKLAEQAEALEGEINKNAEVIARRYQRASDKGKERLLAIQGVRELLAEDGSVRKTALNEGVAEIAREKAVGAMSGSLALTRRNEVANVVAAQNTTIAESLDTEQKSNFAKLEKMLELTGKEAGKQMKVVALEKHDANAFIKDDVMYISKDRLADKNATARDFAHEVFHFAEGTKEYRDVAKMFDRMTIDGKNLFDLATDEVKSLGYEVDAKVFEMLKEGKTAEEITNTGVSEHDVRLALSEIRAKQSEMMFGNAEVINKMAEADQSLAKKILKRLKETIKVIEAVFKGDKETLETLKVLRHAEKLWQDALAVGGMNVAKAQGKITVEGAEADGSIANEYEQVIQMSRASKELAEKLDKEGHETVYRAMQVIDGKLYPPMAAKIDGKLVEPTQLNVWYQADEHPELVDKNGKFKLDKANGSSISAAYNPYWHTSRSMLNDQFSSAYKRPNLVVVECEVPTSGLTSNYKAEGAKDAVGEVNWHSGVVSSKLRGEKARKVILSRYVKVKRIVPNTEVAKNIAQLLEGTNISIPINVVTPSLREALLDEGVEISGVKGLQTDVKERVKAEGIDISNPEERARISEIKFSRAYANDITDGHYDENGKLIDAGQRQVNEKYGLVGKAVLDKAIKEQHEVVDMLNKIDDFLPEDEKEYDVLKKHKVIKGNASYGRSVENTTICVRTLAYNQFVNKVQRVLKRPMTASESFLVSQMLYKIAKEPQCLYCYVSLDRKAYNEFLLKYLTERNKVIDRYKTMTEAEKKVARQVPTDADFVKTTSAYNKNKSKNPLYADFIKGKKNTDVMQERFSQWLALIDSGAAESDILSLEDVATTEGMKEIEGGENLLKQAQLQDARQYAQSASWAKVQEDYIAYYDEIRNPKKMSQELIDTLNREFGLRFYSFSDYSPAFILENMQQITDASIRGLKGLAYTKDLDFVKIFAQSGININVSVFIRSRINQNGEVEYYVDGRQSAVGEGNHKHTDLNELLKLRNEYNNVGIVAVATDDKMVEWACEQEWTDVVIPFHIVRTGQDVAVNYGWTNYRSQQGEKKANKKLFEDWIKENENKSVEVFPTEHHNDYKTYIDLCSKKGVHPKFYKSELYRRALRGDETDQKNYMKLVVETRLSAEEVKPMQPIFNMDAVKSSIDQFVEDGGYHDGYYKEGVDVEEAVQQVAGDVERISEGKMKYSDVDYAYLNEEQVDKMMTDRKSVREHQSMNPDIRYSKRKDSEGNQLTEAQEDFFKDSKVRDENGNLLVVYHGTQTAGFTEFTKTDDIGYFFTNKENNAFTYAGTPTKFEPIIFNNWEEATEYISKNDLGELRYDEESSTYLWDDGWNPIEYAEDDIRRIADDVQSIIYDSEGNKGIYEVYLNLTNPLVINGNGSTWNEVYDYYEGGKWVKFERLSRDDIGKLEDKGYDVYKYEWSITPFFDVINYEMAERKTTRGWVKEAKDAGYDGVIFKDIYDSGSFGYSIKSDVYVAFDSNQIKSIDNKTPTNVDDIRYSKRYIYHAGKFNENGHKAETLYTSTPSRHTGFFGTGTYGVDSDHIHELSLGSYKGKPFSVIDISQYNLFDATNDDTAARLHRFLKDITRKAFESKNSEKVNILYNQFKALFPSDKVIAYDEFKSLIDELKQYVKDNEGYTKSKDLDSVSTKFMKHFGYEGVNTIGTYHADTEYGTVIYDLREDSIVVKESTDETQRKAFTDDVRYSKRSFGDTKTKVELLKSLQGMQLDSYGKYYAKIEDPASFFEEGSLGDRLANQILAMADEAEPNKYAFANDLATHIVNNLAVTTVDDYGLKVVLDNANAIREYRHKLNLDGIKGEIQYRYGKKNNIFALWKAKKGTTGTYIMDAVDELRYKGVIINAEVDADAFFEMLDMVEYANEQANKVLSGTAKDYLKADEYDALVEGLRDDIISFMENKGSKAEWENYYKNITRQADAYLERAKQKARDIEKLATLEAENALEKAKHAYDKNAKKLQNEYETKIKEITNDMQMQAYYDIEYNKQYNKMMGKVWSEANSLTLDNIKKYKNASDLLNKELAGCIKTLSGIKYRGELKNAGARKIFAKFSEWYNTNNPLLTNGLSKEEIDQMMSDEKVTQIGYLDKFVLEGLELIKENQTRTSLGGKTKGQQITNKNPLTYKELLIAQATLASARHILKEYNTLQIAQKRVNLSETATQTEHTAKILSGVTHLKHNATNKIASVVLQGVTPADVIAYQFGYQDNAMSDLFKQIQDGETHARAIEIELKEIVDNFFKEHKSYKKTLSNKVKFGSYEIRKDIALSLYMESLQADAREGLLLGGWGYRDEDGYWKEQGTLTENDLKELSQALSATDKDFTKVLRKFFDKAGEEMIETDHLMKGFSLIENSDNKHYFPIKRYAGDMAKPVADAEASKNAMAVSVANASFTKERVKNIRRLDILPVMSVVNTHARQVSLYTGLALPIREFQRLYNYNTSTDGSTTSVRNTLNEKVWNGVNNYITKLLADIQGIREQADGVSKVLGKVRSNYAKFQLGANIKTWFAQLSGYPAAFPYLSPQSMAKAFTKSLYWKSQNAQNLYKYCEWAKVKAHDGGVVLVETLSDKVGVVGDIATKPIQLMDNFLNRIIWNAAQFEIERTKGFKFGTKENMELAGELHTLIGRKTQGNAATSELSAMQRHRSEIVKGFAMFNSDGFKLISRLFEAINRVRVQKYLAKHHPEMVTEKSQKEAKTFLAKTTTAILTSALIYTLVGELFKFLYDKERKDKDGNEIGFAEDFGMSYLSTVVGMIPIIRDVYSLMVEGYEVDNYAIEGLTNFSDAFGGVIEGVTILASGEPFETKDLARPLKDLVNALGQLTGIPTRNVYNTIYGLTKRFDASAAYKWDSIFYAQGYTKDLKKAIEKDDVDLQKTIIGLMLKDNGLTDTSEKVNNKLRELYAEGYTVLPKTVQDTLHYDGETYNLSNKQVKQFKAVYGKANEEVEDLVNDRHFTSLAAEVQAQAIKWIYDYYYESAVFDTIGEEADSKKQLFGETMDVSKFALTIAACKSIESKLDKKGNVIAGSRKIQIQRLLASLNLSPAEKQLILAYLGYSVADQETLIKAFIRRIGLTKAQQKLLLSYCGIAV